MRTLFEKLNAHHYDSYDLMMDMEKNIIIDRDKINDYIFDNLYMDINKLYPDLKLFFKDGYKSPILQELQNNKIDIISRWQKITDIIHNNEIKKFIYKFYDAELKCINKILSESYTISNQELLKSKYNDDLDGIIDDYIFGTYRGHILENIRVSFLNKNENNNSYFINTVCYNYYFKNRYNSPFCKKYLYKRDDTFSLDKLSYFSSILKYKVENKNNKFNIKDSDTITKEHAIEFGKQYMDVHYMHIHFYSEYFDDL